MLSGLNFEGIQCLRFYLSEYCSDTFKNVGARGTDVSIIHKCLRKLKLKIRKKSVWLVEIIRNLSNFDSPLWKFATKYGTSILRQWWKRVTMRARGGGNTCHLPPFKKVVFGQIQIFVILTRARQNFWKFKFDVFSSWILWFLKILLFLFAEIAKIALKILKKKAYF